MKILKEVVVNFKITLDNNTEVNLSWSELLRLQDHIAAILSGPVIDTQPTPDETEEINKLLYTVDEEALAKRLANEVQHPKGIPYPPYPPNGNFEEELVKEMRHQLDERLTQQEYEDTSGCFNDTRCNESTPVFTDDDYPF